VLGLRDRLEVQNVDDMMATTSNVSERTNSYFDLNCLAYYPLV